MKMIRFSKLFLFNLITVSSLFIACSSSESDTQRGNWKERSVFDGIPRSSAVGFILNNNGYMGTGYDGDNYLKDFWEYNIEGDYWVQKQDFPGTARSAAVSFAVNDKGYVGVGYDGDNELEDFWEYDVTNGWAQKASFGGGVRRSAVGFGVNGFGYIGTGYDGDNDRKDFWKYNPTTNEWTELFGFGGDKRRGAATFTIDTNVYLGTGVSNGLYKQDFWVFDSSTETWTRKRDLDYDDSYFIVRSNAVGLSLNGLGYITTGYNNSALSTIWEYNPSTDEWEEITSLEGSIRQDAVTFYNGSRAFVLMGRSGSLYLDDIYELFPQEDYDDED